MISVSISVSPFHRENNHSPAPAETDRRKQVTGVLFPVMRVIPRPSPVQQKGTRFYGLRIHSRGTNHKYDKLFDKIWQI